MVTTILDTSEWENSTGGGHSLGPGCQGLRFTAEPTARVQAHLGYRGAAIKRKGMRGEYGAAEQR